MSKNIETIYNIDSHIDMEYINNIIQNNSTKKIICFGGGTAADILMQKNLLQHEIYCFLDNNKDIQGTKLYNVEIKSPDILQELEKDSYIVLILSKHVVDISAQLEEIGLKKEQDYFDIYNRFLAYFRIRKFVSYAAKMEKFIERIPDGILETIPVKNTQKIGIVCIAEMIKTVSWYPIAQCIMLRYRGYDVSLIVDCLYSFDDYIYFDGITDIASIYIDYIVEKVKKKWPSFEVLKIDSKNKSKLDDEDIHMTEKYAPYVVKWLDSRKDEVFLTGDENRVNIAEGILQDTMVCIKKFFQDRHFDVINVYTGIHRHRCVYTYLGRKMGIRAATFDGDEKGVSLNETDGISGWSCDIRKLIDGNYFTQNEKERLVNIAKKNFVKRANSTVEDEGYNYQRVGRQIITESYDVIIPLNISWDSAALGLDYVFKDEIEWLQKTLEFLMHNTNVSVMVREHPAQSKTTEFHYRDYTKEVPIINKYPDRIRYAKADEDINTYQFIEKCKLVLPYTSTVGLETIIMGKPIVVHTNVYYRKYVCSADNENDYFKKIENYLTCTQKDDYCQEEVYLAYLFQMNHCIKTKWSECYDEWLDNTLEELNQTEGVDEIIDIIALGLPAIYHNVRKVFAEGE